mgnify:CR=1 FL=1|jgi:flagella basal body P-ring formation protein FlgA
MGLAAGLAMAMSAFWLSAATAADGESAVVPQRTIYPGETITPEMLRVVPVLNPNIASGYASDVAEVAGLVSTRTLLPGRTIPVGALREAWAVQRGGKVSLVFAAGNLVITAQGTPLENAAVGDLVRVRNVESGLVVSGTVMDDRSVRVVTK